MTENMFDSTHYGKTNTSSNQISMYGKDLVDGENNLQFSQYNKSKPRMDSSQAPKRFNSLKYLEKCDKKPAKLNNFSNFLVPNKVFLKSTQPTKKASNANESNEHVSLVARSDENCIVKGKGSLYNEPLLPSSSVCSLEASNDPNFCIRKHEDEDSYESTYSTDNNEEAEVEEKPSQNGKSVKRARNVESHNLYEMKGGDKMNKKMRILKELIPNCNKVDKASLLDDAIHYLKNLKLQLQIMSMGSGVCIPQMMLTQLCGPGMGFNPWSIIPQFSIPPLSSIKDNNTLENMFGTFFNHHAPNNFIPMIIGNNSSTHLVPTTIPAHLPKHLANSTLDKPNFMEC